MKYSNIQTIFTLLIFFVVYFLNFLFLPDFSKVNQDTMRMGAVHHEMNHDAMPITDTASCLEFCFVLNIHYIVSFLRFTDIVAPIFFVQFYFATIFLNFVLLVLPFTVLLLFLYHHRQRFRFMFFKPFLQFFRKGVMLTPRSYL